MSSLLKDLALFAIGWGAKAFYDWKISPVISKSHRRAEQREKEEAAERAQARRRKFEALTDQWRRNREILFRVGEHLKSFDRMISFPDEYHGRACIRLAEVIESAAEQIEGDGYKDVKAKLLGYAKRRFSANGNSSTEELRALFRRPDGPTTEPLVLWQEAQEVIERTKVPPYSEKDL